MNCTVFSDLVRDVAGAQMMDASTRSQALAHTEKCPSCARQLEIESVLTAELREMVSGTADCQPSPQVWDNLSAAFDAQIGSPAAGKRRWYYVAAAIAAMLLLAVAIFSINRRARATTGVEASMPPPSLRAANRPAPEEQPEKVVMAKLRKNPLANRPRHSAKSQQSIQQLDQPKEVVTDFIQLTYGDAGVGRDAQIVRVELPRSAMASFGLPVNVDRPDQRVKADVLLGVDGLAHAIRFVQ